MQPNKRKEDLLNLNACYIIAAQDRRVNQQHRVPYPPADSPPKRIRGKVLPSTHAEHHTTGPCQVAP